MAVVRQQVTADELLHMPDDGFRYELVQGELRRMNPAGNVRGRIARITWRLAQYVEENRLGTVYAAETGFTLSTDPDTVRAPDVAFVSRARVEAVGEIEGFWPEAPDLAVEVVSPGDSYSEVEEKVFDWLEAGTKMVVVVNPRQRSATVYKSPSDITALVEADVLNGGGVVPGFELAVAAKSPARGLRRSTRRPRLYRGHSRRAPDRACAARRSLQCLGGQSVKKSAGLWLDH